MSSRKFPSNDPFDNYIGRSLINWLEQRSPPADARERLLHAVSGASDKKLNFQRIWQSILQDLSSRFGLVFNLILNEEHAKYSTLKPMYLFDSKIHTGVAYYTIIHSFPSGRGLFCF